MEGPQEGHPRGRDRIGYLDGIRAVAIISVLIVHWISSQVPIAYGGYIGVDVFFVLSGYIITLLLWPRLDGPSPSIPGEWRRFLSRRVRRLYPALAGACLGVIALSLVLPGSPFSPMEMLTASALTLSQLVSPIHAGSSLEFGPLGVAWSLSIEWMFYLPWPLVLGYLRRRSEGPRSVAKILMVVATVMFAFSLVQSPSWFYYGPLARIPEILVGASLALWLIQPTAPGPRPKPDRLTSMASFAALGFLLGYTIFGPNQYSPIYRWAGLPLAVVATVTLIWFGTRQQSSWNNTLLCWRPLEFLGRSSYSVYLWHQVPIAFITRQTFPDMNLLAVAAIGGVSALALAAASYRYLERPFLRPRVRRPA